MQGNWRNTKTLLVAAAIVYPIIIIVFAWGVNECSAGGTGCGSGLNSFLPLMLAPEIALILAAALANRSRMEK